MSFFDQCNIRALFFRLIERTTVNQQRCLNRGKVQFRFGSGGMPGRICEVGPPASRCSFSTLPYSSLRRSTGVLLCEAVATAARKEKRCKTT